MPCAQQFLNVKSTLTFQMPGLYDKLYSKLQALHFLTCKANYGPMLASPILCDIFVHLLSWAFGGIAIKNSMRMVTEHTNLKKLSQTFFSQTMKSHDICF